MNFDNGYGVSVIKYPDYYSYGQGLWEVAVLYDGELTYCTEITNNVLGWQTEDDVTEVMRKVQLLSANE